MADVFSIDGRVYNLPILSYQIGTEILDGAATGRTEADGWPMFRQPQGTIININQITFGLCDDSQADFVALIQILQDFGKTDFRTIRLKTQVNEFEQLMYGASFTQDVRIIDHNGKTYWGDLTVKFVAQRAMNI